MFPEKDLDLAELMLELLTMIEVETYKAIDHTSFESLFFGVHVVKSIFSTL